ncbi:MAG: hypothetical protein ACYCWE_13185 [Eubacteriales bacterium]
MNQIHAFGNGQIIGYCRGSNINELLCPYYSAPSICRIETDDNESFSTIRQPESDIYRHISSSATICDVLVPDRPILMRRIDGLASFSIKLPEYTKVCDISARFGSITLQVTIKQGTPVYNTYPAPDFIFCGLILRGVSDYKINQNEIKVNITDGFLITAGGRTYPDFINNIKYAAELSFTEVKTARETDWNNFFKRTYDFNSSIGPVPMRDELLEVIEAVKIADRVQQDMSGGEIAGYPYHLGYVRDNYGVMRGMLSLGMTEEAERILLYFNNEFKHTGCVANAQGLGFFGTKHIHENDCSEITGYITLMITDILRYLPEYKHTALVTEALPMLEWALSEQCLNVTDGMLPFNGDETYIAGGILPRSVLNHGSAEATMLFIEGAKRLFNVMDCLNLCFKGDRSFYEQTVSECERLYRSNFIIDKTLITNNPNRESKNPITMPHFRHGVCEGYCGYFGWNERLNNLYLCPQCQINELISNKSSNPNHNIYKLKSVLLMPPFINSSLICLSDIKDGIDEAVYNFDKNGTLPSRPDGNRCLGYDYGLLLGAMTDIGGYDDIAKKLYLLTLSVSGRTHVWSEYYEDNKPSGTLYRPWESSINIYALINYAKKLTLMEMNNKL